MAADIEKILVTPSEMDVTGKINEIIDNLGDTVDELTEEDIDKVFEDDDAGDTGFGTSGLRYQVFTDGDLNNYSSYARLHCMAGVENLPEVTGDTNGVEFFVDVDVNSDNNMVRQKAMLVADGEDTSAEYIRWGTKNEDGTVTWGEWSESSVGTEYSVLESEIQEISNNLTETAENLDDKISEHIADKNNPHEVTAEQLGLASAYIYRGSVETYDDLPADAEVGDVYNIAMADDEYGIKAGDNVAWTGESWDNLSGTVTIDIEALSDYLPLSGGTLTGDLNVGGITLRASDGHIVLPNGIEIY